MFSGGIKWTRFSESDIGNITGYSNKFSCKVYSTEKVHYL